MFSGDDLCKKQVTYSAYEIVNATKPSVDCSDFSIPFLFAVVTSQKLSSFPLQNRAEHLKCLNTWERCSRSLPRGDSWTGTLSMSVSHTASVPRSAPLLLPAQIWQKASSVFDWSPHSFHVVCKVAQALNLTNVLQNLLQEEAWLVLKGTVPPTSLPLSVEVIKDWPRIPSALSLNLQRS